MRIEHNVAWLWELNEQAAKTCAWNEKRYCSCCILLIRIDTILSKNFQNNFQNLLFKKSLSQLGKQTDIFWKFYSPADTLWLPKTVRVVLRYTTAPDFLTDLWDFHHREIFKEFSTNIKKQLEWGALKKCVLKMLEESVKTTCEHSCFSQKCSFWQQNIRQEHCGVCGIILWRRGVVVITTAQLYSSKPKLRFCIGSSPASSMLEIWAGDNLWHWSWLEIRLNTTKSIHHHHQRENYS